MCRLFTLFGNCDDIKSSITATDVDGDVVLEIMAPLDIPFRKKVKLFFKYIFGKQVVITSIFLSQENIQEMTDKLLEYSFKEEGYNGFIEKDR